MNHKDNLETEAYTIRAMDYTQKKLLHPYFDAEWGKTQYFLT